MNFKRRGDFEDLPEDFELVDNTESIFEDFSILLPIQLRTVYCGVIEGYTYKEISLALNIPEGTVKSRVNRIKKILMKKFGCILL